MRCACNELGASRTAAEEALRAAVPCLELLGLLAICSPPARPPCAHTMCLSPAARCWPPVLKHGLLLVSRRVKRPSGISSLLGKIGSKKQKMSTLEKSKLDWENFKEEEGIVEELAIHNRGKDG